MLSFNVQTLLVLCVNMECHRWKGVGPVQCQWNNPTCVTSAYRTVKQSAFVRVCDSTHMNGISAVHGYDYIQQWIGSDNFVFLFTPP
jgi:hypothetical protein